MHDSVSFITCLVFLLLRPGPERDDNDRTVERSKFKCTLCGEGFSTMSQVILHKRSHTGGGAFSKPSVNNNNTPVGARKKGPYLLNLKTKTENREHLKILESSSKTSQDSTSTTTDPTNKIKKATGKLHQCSQCNQKFVGLSQLTRHEAIHHSEKHSKKYQEGMELHFKCDICWWTFNTHDERKSHRSHHKTEEKLKCSFCRKYLCTPGRLKRHIRLKHNMKHNTPQPNSFKCRVCPETFPTQVEVDNHERRSEHVPEQICRFCGKYYSSVGGRREHEKVHRTKPTTKWEDSKAEKCSICDSWYPSRQSLYRHNYSCHKEHTITLGRISQESGSKEHGNQQGSIKSSINSSIVSNKLIIPDIYPK